MDELHYIVTIILVISFQNSFKKAVRDPYNPIYQIVQSQPLLF